MAWFQKKVKSEVLVVGLGNPGPQYVYSPHNAGFEVADRLVDLVRGAAYREKGHALVCHCAWRSHPFTVIRPMTYMNRSGEAVRYWMRRLDLPPGRVIVAYDDLDISFGAFRLRKSGGTGGHNGMESIIEHLGTREFARLRIGVSEEGLESARRPDYLLTPLEPQRWEILRDAAARAAGALRDSFFMGWSKAMSVHNAKEKGAENPKTH